MGDDLLADGMLPISPTADDDFDPNAVESDDFLDDPDELVLEELGDAPLAAILDEDEDDEDDLLDE